MDSGLLRQFRQLVEKEKVKLDKKLLIFLFFVVVSSVFWFLNTLSKEYTTTISYPVRYTNFPKNKILVGDTPSDLTLKVNAQGYKLLTYRISSTVKPIIFDVNSFSLNRVNKKGAPISYILTDFANDKIAQQLSSSLTIIDILPDTLFFQFADIATKKVMVVPDLIVTCEKQYMLNGKIKLIPDSIIISGAKSIIDSIKNVKTSRLILENLKKETHRSLSIQKMSGVKYSDKCVVVDIPVEKFTESLLTIPLEVKHVPKIYHIRTFPDVITVSYRVGLSDYDKIKEHHFKAIVDFKDIEAKKSNKVKVKLVKFPHNVKSIKYNPRNVEYIIEK